MGINLSNGSKLLFILISVCSETDSNWDNCLCKVLRDKTSFKRFKTFTACSGLYCPPAGIEKISKKSREIEIFQIFSTCPLMRSIIWPIQCCQLLTCTDILFTNSYTLDLNNKNFTKVSRENKEIKKFLLQFEELLQLD